MQFLHQKAPQIFLSLTEDMETFIQKGFFGGRCELIKQGKFSDVAYFDFPSMYGKLLCDDFPKYFSWLPIKSNLTTMGLPHGFIEATVEIPSQYLTLSPLPKRHEKYGVIYPWGIFRAVFWYEELNLLNYFNMGKIIQIHRILYASDTTVSCQLIAKQLLGLREAGSSIAKRILNSVYGRLAINPSFVKTEFFLSQNSSLPILNLGDSISFWRDLIILKKNLPVRKDLKRNKAAAAIITSRARCKVYSLALSIAYEGDLLYLDTDALFLKPKCLQDFLFKYKIWSKLEQIQLYSERSYAIATHDNNWSQHGKVLSYRGSFTRLNLQNGCTQPHTINENVI
jgi:hypothetical protein